MYASNQNYKYDIKSRTSQSLFVSESHSWAWVSKFAGCVSPRTHYNLFLYGALFQGQVCKVYGQFFCTLYRHGLKDARVMENNILYYCEEIYLKREFCHKIIYKMWLCLIMQPKKSCFIKVGSCNFSPSLREESLCFMPHHRVGQVCFFIHHIFKCSGPLPPHPSAYILWPVPYHKVF